MNISGNTIVLTGGGSGIGRGLAEAFHQRGNQVIIAGRRTEVLDQVVAANPGMASVVLDITEEDSIQSFAKQIAEKFPAANVLINNSGVMQPENLKAENVDTRVAESTIATNLLGPIRLSAALLPQLRKQSRATVIMVSSGLAFVPLSMTPTYCATKAAIHSYTQSMRQQLKGTSVEVIELPPPYVQTELMGAQHSADPRAMPLKDFINDAMSLIETQPGAVEINVERVKPLRFAAESGTYDAVFKTLNEMMPH